MSELLTSITEQLVIWSKSAVDLLPNIIAAIITLFITFFVANQARRLTFKKIKKSDVKDTLTNLISTTTYVTIIIVGTFIGLEILQLSKAVTSLLAGVGILGLALAFAFQDIVANYVSGIILALKDIFSVGDLVKTNDYFGTVQAINLRTTTLDLLSGQTVIIPNNEILSSPLINYSEKESRRVDIECGVGYDDDLDQVKSIALNTISELESVDKEKSVDFFYNEFGGSSVNFVVRFWINFEQSNKPFLQAQSDAIKALKQRFDEKNIDIPYPIQTIDVNNTTASALQQQ